MRLHTAACTRRVCLHACSQPANVASNRRPVCGAAMSLRMCLGPSIRLGWCGDARARARRVCEEEARGDGTLLCHGMLSRGNMLTILHTKMCFGSGSVLRRFGVPSVSSVSLRCLFGVSLLILLTFKRTPPPLGRAHLCFPHVRTSGRQGLVERHRSEEAL